MIAEVFAYGEIILAIAVAFLLAYVSLKAIETWLHSLLKKEAVKRTIKRIRLKYYLFFILIAIYSLLGFISIEESIKTFLYDILPLLLILVAGYLLVRIFDGIFYGVLEELAKKTETKLDDMLLPILRNTLYLTIALVVIIMVLAKLGYDVSAFIASLGIGGLAIAMASQQILQNFFGGVVLLIDGTFRLGDRIAVKGIEGEVVGISLRTTKIKKDDGSLVSIPNSIILKEAVTVFPKGRGKK